MKNEQTAIPRSVFHGTAGLAMMALYLFAAPASAAVATWDGGGVDASWRTGTNWTSNVTPTFNNALDVYFYTPGAGNLVTNYIGGSGAITIRSLNFTADADGDVVTRLNNTLTGGTTGRNIQFGGAGGATITSDAGAAGNFTLGTATGNGNLAMLENLTISHNGSGILRISRPVIGTGFTLTSSGSGLVVVDAACTYSGYTVVSAGTLALGAGGSIASSPAVSVAGGATFDVTAAGYTLANAIVLQGGGSITGTLTTAAGSGILPGGNGAVGTLTFRNDLNLNAGSMLAFDLSSNPLSGNDQVVVSGTVTNTGNAGVALRGLASGALGEGTYTLMTYAARSGDGTFVLEQNIPNVTLNVNATSLTLTVGAGGAVTSKIWTGDGSGNAWDIAGSANWVYSGGGAQVVYNDGDAVTFDDSTTNAVSLGVAVAPAGVTVNAVRHYVVTGGGGIGGSGVLTKWGAGILKLTSASSYSGGTVHNGGSIYVAADQAAGSGTITVNTGNSALAAVDAAVTLSNDFDIVANTAFFGISGGGGAAYGYSTNLTVTGAVNLNGGTKTLSVRTSKLFLSGAVTNGGLIFNGNSAAANMLILSGANTYTGGTTIATGGRLNINHAQALGTGPLTISGTQGVQLDNTTPAAITLANNNPLNLNRDFTFLGSSSLNVGTGAVTMGTNLVITVNDSMFTLGGAISDGGNGYGLTKAGAGDLTLAGNNTFSGPVLVNAGVIRTGHNNAFGTGLVTFNGGQWNSSGNTVITNAIVFAKNTSGNSLSAATEFKGAFTSNGNFSVNGFAAGTVKLSGDNSGWSGSWKFTGQNKLQLNHLNALGAGTTITFSDNVSSRGVLESLVDLSGGSGLTHAISLGSNTSNSMATFKTTADLKLSGSISGPAGVGFIKSGAGTLILGSTNTFSGEVNVTAGTLKIEANDALPSGCSVTLGGATLDMGSYTNSPTSLGVTASSTLLLGGGQLSFTSQTNTWSGTLALSGELGRYSLRFQPALSEQQLALITYPGGAVYCSAEGYLRAFSKRTLLLLQ